MRNARILYEELDGKNTVDCVASVCNTDDEDLFYAGFVLALKEYLKQNGSDFGMVNLVGIGNNTILIRKWKGDPVFRVPGEWITYNLIVPQSPLNTEQCFVLA
jgi:hypothetical protein